MSAVRVGKLADIRALNWIPVYVVLMMLLAFVMPPVADAAQHDYAFLSTSAVQHNQRAIAQDAQRGQLPAMTQQAYRQLLQQADKALKRANPSVMDKNRVPPSGSKHDYLSLSAYWWPDSQKNEGLPWIRKDGLVNPASKNDDSDGVRLADFTAQVQTLTLAWYFSGQQKYADKAISLIRTWFIAPKTRISILRKVYREWLLGGGLGFWMGVISPLGLSIHSLCCSKTNIGQRRMSS